MNPNSGEREEDSEDDRSRTPPGVPPVGDGENVRNVPSPRPDRPIGSRGRTTTW